MLQRAETFCTTVRFKLCVKEPHMGAIPRCPHTFGHILYFRGCSPRLNTSHSVPAEHVNASAFTPKIVTNVSNSAVQEQ